MKPVINSIYFKFIFVTLLYSTVIYIFLRESVKYNIELLITYEGKRLFVFGIVIGVLLHSFITFFLNLFDEFIPSKNK